MRKLALVCAFVSMLLFGQVVHARKEYGIFNSVAIGLNVGTTGVGVDVATPITKYVMLRGGVSFMPGITIKTDVDVEVDDPTGQMGSYPARLAMEGSLKRTQGELVASVYPFPSFPFFISAGAFFGGDKLATIQGHSEELKNYIAQGSQAGVAIGDYVLPVDKNGNVSGGLKVKAVRPYVGIGFGRIVPKKRLGFSGELGVQVHGTPEVYTDNGNLGNLMSELDPDDDFTKIIDKLTVYPVLKLRLTGRIF